ncbi:MAG: family 16 glycoside hydrolase [Rhodothermales bacterium]
MPRKLPVVEMKWIAAALFVFAVHGAAAQTAPNFAPDWTFKGNDLSALHRIGQTEWKASSGVITGAPKGQGGWLLFEPAYQDMQFALRFRCASACDAGVMLRAEKTAGGGYEGLFVAFSDSMDIFRLAIDANGREIRRESLRAARVMMRMAPAPQAGPVPMATAVPIEDGWNALHVDLDANILRARLNGWGPSTSGATGEDPGGYGVVALYVGGSGAVEFDGIAAADANRRAVPGETISSHFTMQRLDEFYYAWDTAIADINQDGVQDVVAGPYYYLGPDYTTRHEIYFGETNNPSTTFVANMVTHAYDFTGDGWPDVLATESRPMVLYVNPRGESRRWDRYEVMPGVVSENTLLRDMDGDGLPEVVYALGRGGILAYAEPDPAKPTAPWTVHQISGEMGFGTVIHGLGAGDVNGDGRNDILIRNGWFEQPAKPTADGTWPFHAFPFATAGSIEGSGGGTMTVVDLNGDGLNDVATSLNAHGWGMAWFEQVREAGGITFKPHLIMGDMAADNPGDVAFSELHGGVETADLNGDGLPDLITGKRHWSHLDSSIDPDPYGEAVLYVYRTVRDARAPGGLAFEPELIHNRSGVGSQFEVTDLNQDGAADIVTSGNRGTFIFWGQRR